MEGATQLKKRHVDFVIGGFHLYNPSRNICESNEHIEKIGEFFQDTKAKFYTCHCTGVEPYKKLKDKLRQKIEYLETGSYIEL
jgi:7,8-dihydropterin-6-yl-methyl-4-(beta-D-ribofuranosyl)aminobenzene 5'-phosphate synthase